MQFLCAFMEFSGNFTSERISQIVLMEVYLEEWDTNLKILFSDFVLISLAITASTMLSQELQEGCKLMGMVFLEINV